MVATVTVKMPGSVDVSRDGCMVVPDGCVVAAVSVKMPRAHVCEAQFAIMLS